MLLKVCFFFLDFFSLTKITPLGYFLFFLGFFLGKSKDVGIISIMFLSVHGSKANASLIQGFQLGVLHQRAWGAIL